jgi:hypothetical protein
MLSDGLPIGLGLDSDQLRALADRQSGPEDNSDSMEIDREDLLLRDPSPECYALSRSVTLKRRHYDRMTREEIVRAKDIVQAVQKRRIERLEKKVRELGDLLHAADRIQTLTMEVLSLSLDQDCNS